MVNKTLEKLGDSRRALMSFPAPIQDGVGYALYLAQVGEKHASAKPMHGLGPGVMEIASNDASGAFRAVYTVAIGTKVYVVHAFQKKSKVGVSTPASEIDIIRQRLKRLREEVRNERNDS